MIVTIPSISVSTPDLAGILARTPFRAHQGSHAAPARTPAAVNAVITALIVVMAVVAGAWAAGIARTPFRPARGRHAAGRRLKAAAVTAPVSLAAARARLRPVTEVTGRAGIAAEIAACRQRGAVSS